MKIRILSLLVILGLGITLLTWPNQTPKNETRISHSMTLPHIGVPTACAAGDCDTTRQVCRDIWRGMESLCVATGHDVTVCLLEANDGYRSCVDETSGGKCDSLNF